MEIQKNIVVSALVVLVAGGIAVIYAVAGLPSGGGSYPNTGGTLEPLARALAGHGINGGSLCFGILTLGLLWLIWFAPAGKGGA